MKKLTPFRYVTCTLIAPVLVPQSLAAPTVLFRMTIRLRKTRQKDAIRTAFEQAARPLSPDEALTAAQRMVEGISVATVYRNINSLVAERWLSTVEVPGEPSRYEVAGKGHHHHFHCKQCGRIYDLPGCVLPAVTPDVPSGFQLTGHELFLYGRCSPCTTQPLSAA